MKKVSFLSLKFILLIAIILLPFLLFGKIAFITIFLTFIFLLSRSNPIYDNLKIEIHSILILAISHIYGPWVCVYAACASAPFQNVLGKFLGTAQWPHFIVIDTIYMTCLSFVAAILSAANLQLYGFLAIVVGVITLRTVRVLFFMDPLTRAIPLVAINLIFNYLLVQNLLPVLIRIF